MDWIITIPKTISWEDYVKELDAVKDFNQEMNYKLPFKPKELIAGDRCFVTWNGKVRGWMFITKVSRKDAFTCSTTGKEWPAGWYISRSGPFTYVEATDFLGFRGIRKYEKGSEL